MSLVLNNRAVVLESDVKTKSGASFLRFSIFLHVEKTPTYRGNNYGPLTLAERQD